MSHSFPFMARCPSGGTFCYSSISSRTCFESASKMATTNSRSRLQYLLHLAQDNLDFRLPVTSERLRTVLLASFIMKLTLFFSGRVWTLTDSICLWAPLAVLHANTKWKNMIYCLNLLVRLNLTTVFVSRKNFLLFNYMIATIR